MIEEVKEVGNSEGTKAEQPMSPAAIKEIEQTAVFDAWAYGILIGIAIYSTFNSGLGLLTFLPLIYIPIAKKNKAKRESIQK